MTTIDLFSVDTWYKNIKGFENLIPQPDPDIVIDGDRYSCQTSVSIHDLMIYTDLKQYLQRTWRNLYFAVISNVAKLCLGRSEYFVVRFLPRVDDRGDALIQRLDVEISVAQTKQFVVPEFRYEVINHERTAIEWRCGYCNSPNEMKERHCTQCGSPRTLLIQEMM